jgi:hypothetical protein
MKEFILFNTYSKWAIAVNKAAAKGMVLGSIGNSFPQKKKKIYI